MKELSELIQRWRELAYAIDKGSCGLAELEKRDILYSCAAELERTSLLMLPVDVARDLWLALHKTRNSSAAASTALEPNEEKLYQYLTERFCCVAVSLSVQT